MLETLLKPDNTAERCGLILKDGRIIEIPNIAPDPEQGFYMDSTMVLPYLEAEEISGTWHTHPHTDPTLSSEDHNTFMAWPNIQHFIIGFRDGAVAVVCYRIEDGVLVLCD